MANENVNEYLEYYLKLDKPGFALLLNGEWGSGKTWFIKNYIGESKDFLLVSLYGTASLKEISDSLFAQLHPLLASKGAKVAGAILKGLLKTTIKIDLDRDSKEDASVTSQVPDINLPDYLKNLENKVIIFDDLERCSLPIANVLGYINQFVEINGLKIIILANEKEIIRLNGEKLDIPYVHIKEKLIGRTFDIIADFDSAIKTFLTEIKDNALKGTLSDNLDLIKTIFKESKYENLRHLRQTILDFQLFQKYLPEIPPHKTELKKHIISLFFSISFEIKKGLLLVDDIPKLFSFDLLTDSNDKAHPASIAKDKYKVYNNYHHPIDGKTLTEFFKHGTAKESDLSSSIKTSQYYLEENTKDWQKLWHYHDMEDGIFAQLSDTVYKSLQSLSELNQYEILHVTGLFISLIHKKLASHNKSHIVRLAKKNIDNLFKKGLLDKITEEHLIDRSSYSLGYEAKDSPEFKDVAQYLVEHARIGAKKSIHTEAARLLDLIKTSINEFEGQVTISTVKVGDYYDIPILIYIKPKLFVEAFLNHNNSDKRDLSYAINVRYKYSEINKKLLTEKDWLVQVLKLLTIESEKKKYVNSITGYILKETTCRILQNCINRLSEIDDK